LLVCPANIRKNSRSAAILPRDLCFIGKKVQDARQTSKDVGANVEGDLEAAHILHTFALSKDENKSKDENIVLTI